jgi:ankyrin repeat protein
VVWLGFGGSARDCFHRIAHAVKLLLAGGADPKLKDTAYRMTALHFAGAKGYVDAAEALIADGVEINIREGRVLHHAVADGRLEMIQFLVAHGTNVSIADSE